MYNLDARLAIIRSAERLSEEQKIKDNLLQLQVKSDLNEDERKQLIQEYEARLTELEESKPKAEKVEFEGRITVEFTSTDGVFLFTNSEGEVTRGLYYWIEWEVRHTKELSDTEVTDIMRYFEIFDGDYAVKKAA